MPVLLAIALVLGAAPDALTDYVGRRDGVFAWSLGKKLDDLTELKLTSQTWQGHVWKHELVIVNPPTPIKPKSDGMILYVTGDRVDRADLPFMRSLSAKSGLRVATLFQVPNQPLFDLEEDALIAHTFGKYLETGDSAWPLLFPMTKAAIRAMDAVQRWDPSVKRFVVTGASKRGWTTWLAGATGDRRVAGIAPMVFDFLDFERQLAHQLKAWGAYSEMLGDYVSRGQAEAAQTPEGRKLAAMVDPISYRTKLAMPKLIVLGSNDRYWTSDAHRLYVPSLPGHTFFRIVPNVGHNLGGGEAAIASVAFFARGVFRRLDPRPQQWFDAGRLPTDGALKWMAFSGTQDFRDSVWSHEEKPGAWSARFAEIPLRSGDLTASFTTPMTVEPGK